MFLLFKLIINPNFLRNFIRSFISGSIAQFLRIVTPSALAAANNAFSVAPT